MVLSINQNITLNIKNHWYCQTIYNFFGGGNASYLHQNKGFSKVLDMQCPPKKYASGKLQTQQYNFPTLAGPGLIPPQNNARDQRA